MSDAQSGSVPSVPGTAEIAALKAALAQKKTTLDKILKMAKELRVDHQIMSYLEAVA